MATLVPTNSSWFLVLKEVADKWNKLSNGRVKVILYGGGTKGDDPEVVQAMRLGELQGAVLTSVGMAEIEKSVYAVSIPMAFDSYEEVYAVLEKMRPRFESAIDAKGFVVLNWADAGWIQFFTTKPVATPDDLKKLTLFQWAGDPKSLEIWKTAGFNVRPAAVTDLPTGSADRALPGVHAVAAGGAASASYYEKREVHDRPASGRCCSAPRSSRRTPGTQVPADIKPALLKAMQEAGAKLQADIRQSGEKDIAAMKSAGLTVVPVDAKTKDLWRKTAESAYGKVRGDFVPADAFDAAMKARDEYRKAQAARAQEVGEPAMIETSPESAGGGRQGFLGTVLKGAEQTILTATLSLVTILLLIDAIGRPLGGFHVPGKDEYVKQLTLWLAFVGGLAAAAQGTHLTLSTAEVFGEGRLRRLLEAVRPLGGRRRGRGARQGRLRHRQRAPRRCPNRACCRSGSRSGGRKPSCRSRSA